MDPAEIAARLSLPIAAAISVFLSKHRPTYRPVCETLVLAACFDTSRGMLAGTWLSPPLLLTFPCLSASVALCVLAKLPRWPVGLAWGLLAGATLVPSSRALLEPLGRFYGGVHLGSVLLQLFAIWRWSRRDVHGEHLQRLRELNRSGDRRSSEPNKGERQDLAPANRIREIFKVHGNDFSGFAHAGKDARTVSDRSDTVATFACLLLFAGDLAALFGPFAGGDPHRDWYVARAQTVLLFAIFNVWQLCQLRRFREIHGPRIV